MSVRVRVMGEPSRAAMYRLCRQFPPVTAEPPRCVRWGLWSPWYSTLAAAFALGRAGANGGPWAPTSYSEAAWLAGRDEGGHGEPMEIPDAGVST